MTMASINSVTHQLMNKGQIQLILGPMFSGKTTELIRRMRRFQVAQQSCLVIKYAKDTRYSEGGVATHDKSILKATPATKLLDVITEAKKYSVIGIDEGQFFPDLIEFSESMASTGKTVIVAALDGTFQRKPFGKVLELIPLAESVIKLSAVCMNCAADAAYTKRLGTETAVEVIGGKETYMATCRECFHKLPDAAQLEKVSSKVHGDE